MIRVFWLLLLISSAALADTRNVVLIIADDQGLDLSVYDNRILRTPSLASLAGRGT
jgi:arylsulfatase A-like enzyme